MKQVTRIFQVALVIGGLSILLSGSCYTAAITYGSYNRPVSFVGIELDSVLYDVSVIWDSNYATVYSTHDPLFMGDEQGAIAAISRRMVLLRQCLAT